MDERDKAAGRIVMFRQRGTPRGIDALSGIEEAELAELGRLLCEFDGTEAPEESAPEQIIKQNDEAVLGQERAFKKRFGFDLNQRRRNQLIDLKHRADLTDREIRLLKRTGSLEFRPSGAEISTSNIIEAWGYVQIAAATVLMLAGLLVLGRSEAPTLAQFSLIAAVEVALMALVWGLELQYVRPNCIRRRMLDSNRAVGAKGGRARG
jgi:hypothetical protein